MDEITSSTSRRPLLDRFFSFSETRPPSDRLLFLLALITFLVATSMSLFWLNDANSEPTPTKGGTFSEGIIGTPRFVNPILAITPADHDLSTLIYSGLLKLAPDGSLVNDAAESITISEDGMVYSVKLRSDVYFHDGEKLNADDVAFTVSLIQDPALKSPLRGTWNGVTVEVISDSELNFVLEEAYVPFIENLTLGILPKHIWEQLATEEIPFSQHNVEPVGFGPYKITEVVRNQSGLVQSYTLTAHNPEVTNIEKVILRFYQDENDLLTDLKKGVILATASLTPELISSLDQSKFTIAQLPLPRVFAVFFNQNRNPALREQAVREALSVAIDRDALVQNVLAGYGIPTDSPIPNGFSELQSTSTTPTSTDPISRASAILEAAGWERSPNGRWVKEIDETETELAISIATANADIFENSAAAIETVWSKLGVDVSVALYEQADLVQSVIRPRDYQALLFGTDIGRSLDLYPFWHSSQQSDPGLNVARYTSISTDADLDQSRTEQDGAARMKLLRSIETDIKEEVPAAFLYNPVVVYVVRTDVNWEPTSRIRRASDRFMNIATWHMNEESLWPIFR